MRLGEGTMTKEELIAYIIELLKDASEHELKAIKCFISAYLGRADPKGSAFFFFLHGEL